MENSQSWSPAEVVIYDAVAEARELQADAPSTMRRIYNKLCEGGFIVDQDKDIVGVDHIAVLVWDIETWTERYTRLGAEVIYDNSDMSPSSSSSAKLRGLKWGNMLLALLEPINREEESQVYHALRKHGDHFFQHIAIRVKNLHQFKQVMEAAGASLVGDILERSDAFGPIRQIFGQIFDKSLDADEGNFWEFVERPTNSGDSQNEALPEDFDDTAAEKLFKNVEDAASSGNRIQFME